MFWKFLSESLWRPGSRHHAVWAVLAVALGTTIAAAMLNVSLDIGDKVGKELRSLGANIVITPAADSLPVEIGGIDYRPVSQGTYIPESSLPKLKEIFWRHNIVAFSPFLYVPVHVNQTVSTAVMPQSGSDGKGTVSTVPNKPENVAASAAEVAAPQALKRPIQGGDTGMAEAMPLRPPRIDGLATTLVGTWFNHGFNTSNGEHHETGIRALNPTWKLEGEWIDDSADAQGSSCLAGRSLADALHAARGSVLTVQVDGEAKAFSCTLKGILSTGGAEDNQILTSLALAQSAAGLQGKARKVQASALIKPENETSRRDPKAMSPAEFERWYCSPYISSILHQIGEVLPGTTARQIQPVAETEGKVLSKLTFLMGTLAIVALIAAALSISSIASLRVLKRRQEISLMKAIGAQDRLIASLFLAEAALQGIAGGVVGFGGGLVLARVLLRVVFNADLTVNWMILPLTLLVALLVSFGGTWGPLKLAMSYQPAAVLRGE